MTFSVRRWPVPELTFLALFSALVAACSHLPANPLAEAPPSPCTNVDWYEMGRLDGQSGAPLLGKMEEHEQRCLTHPHAFDAEIYVNGRDSGLVEFCSAAGGLEAGKSGVEYDKVCPAHLEPNFLANYKLGLRIRELESENADLEARINNLARLISPTSPSPSIRSQIDQLKNRRVQNNSQIIDLENRFETSQF